MKNKSISAYRTIGEVARDLDLISSKNGSLQTHTLRFWEKEIKQIRPSIRAGKRRYYSTKDFEIIKFVKHLLKDQGLTIKGVKKLLDKKNTDKLDDQPFLSVNNKNFKNTKDFKNKVSKIARILKELKDLRDG